MYVLNTSRWAFWLLEALTSLYEYTIENLILNLGSSVVWMYLKGCQRYGINIAVCTWSA